MICTAESVVLTPWPPLPEARQTLISKSSGWISMSTSCRLREDGHGGRAGVDAALGLGRRHALDAMHARSRI